MNHIAKRLCICAAAFALPTLLVPSNAHAVENILCPRFAPLFNGQCQDASGFSGAALASQALTSLTQTSTQAGVNNALGKLKERREQEANACAPGFSRIGGECRRNAVTAPVAAGKMHAKAVGRGKRLPMRQGETRPDGPGFEEVTQGSGETTPTLFGAPIPITPDVAFGAWIEGYGDYERRNAAGDAYVTTGPGVAKTFVPLRVSAHSQSSSYGLQLGLDFTTRGVLRPNDGLIAGLLIGGARTDFELRTQSLSSDYFLVDHGSSRVQASLTGGSGGVYLTYFDGPFSADFIAKTDAFILSANFSEFIAFAPNAIGSDGRPIYAPAARLYPYSPVDPLPVVDVNLAGDVNYRFPLAGASLWVEPTFGVQYTTTMYDWRGVRMGLADGQQVRLQGGARLGYGLSLGAMPATLTVTGLVFDDVLVSGGFIKSLAFNGGNFLAQSNEGQARGRGIVALNFDHGEGLASYIQGEVRGGSGLFGAGGKAGVRYSW